jgi:hypothetical protein
MQPSVAKQMQPSVAKEMQPTTQKYSLLLPKEMQPSVAKEMQPTTQKYSLLLPKKCSLLLPKKCSQPLRTAEIGHSCLLVLHTETSHNRLVAKILRPSNQLRSMHVHMPAAAASLPQSPPQK